MNVHRTTAAALMLATWLCGGCADDDVEYTMHGQPIGRDTYQEVRAAQDLGKEGRYREAVALLTEAANREPSVAAIWCGRGSCYHALGEDRKAVADYTRAIDLGTGSPRNAYVGRAISYQALGQHARAVADFTRAIELSPSDPALHFERARAWQMMGNTRDAVDGYTRVVRLDPNHPAAYFNRGTIYLDWVQLPLARDDFTAAIKRDPKNWKYLCYRAETLSLMGDARGALADAEKAVQLGGDVNPEFLADLRAGKTTNERIMEEWLRDLKARPNP